MRRCEIFPATCIWANSEFLEVPCGARSVQNAGHRKRELGDFGVELDAVFRYHLVAALHGADWRRHRGSAAVFEAFARL